MAAGQRELAMIKQLVSAMGSRLRRDWHHDRLAGWRRSTHSRVAAMGMSAGCSGGLGVTARWATWSSAAAARSPSRRSGESQNSDFRARCATTRAVPDSRCHSRVQRPLVGVARLLVCLIRRSRYCTRRTDAKVGSSDAVSAPHGRPATKGAGLR
jgi:hypothetical protein